MLQWSLSFSSSLTSSFSDARSSCCLPTDITSSGEPRVTPFIPDFSFLNRNLSQMFKSGDYGLCFSYWIFACLKNVMVLLHMWRWVLSHRRTISFMAIGFLQTWLKRLLVSLRSWMVTSELTVCPGGSKVSEYRFGLQVIATKSIGLRFVILARATVSLVCFFSIQAFSLLLLIPNKPAFVFNNVM